MLAYLKKGLAIVGTSAALFCLAVYADGTSETKAAAQPPICTPEQISNYDACKGLCEGEYQDAYYSCFTAGGFNPTCYQHAHQQRVYCEERCGPYCEM